MARRNIWEQIWESTEGPTVTVTIPRDHAESLLKVLAASLEEEMPDDMDMGDEEDLDSVDDLDFGDGGDMQGPPEEDDLDGMGDMDLDFMPAGDDDSDDEPSPPKKKAPPKKDDGGKKKEKEPKKDDSSDDDDKKDEAAGDFRPQTALGESSFARAARALTKPRRKR